MNVAIIPARAGSKRLPGKNIKNFLGKPVIAYSIEAALSLDLFDQVLVTTDSDEIADVAREYGAIVPFKRPLELSGDHTPTAPVIEHALSWLINEGKEPIYACCIYATAPFVQLNYLKEGYELLKNTGCSSSYSITSYPFPILRASKINKDGNLKMFWPEYELTRSQDLQEAFHDAGQFYWLNVKKFLIEKRLYTSDSQPVILPRYLVQDIDTMEDWIRAEYMYKATGLKNL